MRFWILLFTTFLSGSQSFALEDDLLKRNIEEGARQLEQLIEQNRKAAANKQVYIIDFAGANATGQGYSDETPNGRLKLGEKEYAVKQWSENARTAVTAEIARLNADPAMEGSKIYVGVNLNLGSIYTSKEIIDYDPVSGVNVLSKQHKTTGVSQKYEELKTIVQGIANQVGGKYVFVAYGYFVGQGLTSEKGSTKLYSLVGHVSSQQLTVQPNLPVIFDKLRTIPSDQIGPKLIPYMRGISDAISGIDYNLKNSFNVLQSKYLEKLQKFPKDTAVSQNEYTLAVRITHDASSPAAIKQVKDAVDHIQAKQIILWLDYRTSKYEFFYGSGVGSDKRVDALENLVRYLPEPAFWGLPNDFNPLLSLLSGIAGAIGELQIPPRFYDPDQSNYDPFFDVILLTGTKLFGTATDSDFFRDIAASTGKYTITRMDVAFNCGFWNGLVDQIKGIPESGAYLVKFFTDGATRKELKDGLKKFRQTAQEKGGYWNSITSMAVQQYEHANPCVRSAGFGTATANLLTIPLAFVKTGALSKLSTLMDALDPFSLLFKPVAAFSKFAIKQGGNVVAGAYKLGAGAVTATLENGAVVLKMVGKVGEALKNIDWKIARVVVLEGTDGRLVPMLVLTGSDPLTSALQKVKEVVETTGKNASGVDENRLLRTADGSELRVLEQANGNEIVGIVKQLDWLMAYPKLLERLKTLDGEALARFAGDFEGNAAMLARFEGNTKLVRAWEAIFDLPLLRTNLTKLQAVTDFAAFKNIDPSIIKTELQNLPDFKEDLVKGFEISNGTAQLPKIVNKEVVSTTGALHGSFVNGQFVPNGNALPNGIMDFVALPDGQILLGTKHSFLSQGADVLAAGTVKLSDGVVKDVTNLSGHYLPSPGEAINFLRIFKNAGVNIDQSFLSIYKGNGIIFRQINFNSNAHKLYK